MNQKNIKIIIAGGGTGGHIFPGLAIAGALQRLRPSVDILFVGAKGKMEMQRVPDAGYRIEGLDIAGWNRSSIFKNVMLPFKLIRSFWQVRKIFRQFQPNAVVGVGGYSSFPVLKWAQSHHTPSFIHESNSLPGVSNQNLGKKATKIFVASTGMEKYFPKEKIVVSGNPVREMLLAKVDRKQAVESFKLNPDLKTVLVVGGSLGAKSINETILAHIGEIEKNNLQLIWQTGKLFSVPNVVAEAKNIRQSAFIGDMRIAYGAADVVVARAGAMTIAELKVQGKASILVPYPFAAEDHQTVNAKNLVEKGAARMIADKEAGTKLIPALVELINNQQAIDEMESNISREAIVDADKRIAEEILKSIEL